MRKYGMTPVGEAGSLSTGLNGQDRSGSFGNRRWRPNGNSATRSGCIGIGAPGPAENRENAPLRSEQSLADRRNPARVSRDHCAFVLTLPGCGSLALGLDPCSDGALGSVIAISFVHTSWNRTAPFGRLVLRRQVQAEAVGAGRLDGTLPEPGRYTTIRRGCQCRW
jgi:hypothetical protein